MALIHERICQSRDLNRLDFYDYVRRLVSGLFQSYGRKEGELDVVLEIEDVHIGIDEAVPSGMILGELLSNSLKHAFPSNKGRNGQRGELRVQVSASEDGLVDMVVADNGVGIPPGLDFMHTRSLGLELVTTLTEQLGGTIELDRSRGTEFLIRFRSSALTKGG
jgi:two-component sensor histidine kinase